MSKPKQTIYVDKIEKEDWCTLSSKAAIYVNILVINVILPNLTIPP